MPDSSTWWTAHRLRAWGAVLGVAASVGAAPGACGGQATSDELGSEVSSAGASGTGRGSSLPDAAATDASLDGSIEPDAGSPAAGSQDASLDADVATDTRAADAAAADASLDASIETDAAVADASLQDAVHAATWPDPDATVVHSSAFALCCHEDSDCGADATCLAGACFHETAACADDSVCPDGWHCDLELGRCRSGGCFCASDGDCLPNARCIDTPVQCGTCIPEAGLCEPTCSGFEGLAFRTDDASAQLSMAGVVTEVTERTLVVTDEQGVGVTFVYTLPAADAQSYQLPLAEGESVTVTYESSFTELWVPYSRALTIRGADGELLFAAAVGSRRAASVAGVTAEARDMNCDIGIGGDCIQIRYAMALIEDSRGLLTASNGDERQVVTETGQSVTLVLSDTLLDEDTCQPPEHHGAEVAFMLLGRS